MEIAFAQMQLAWQQMEASAGAASTEVFEARKHLEEDRSALSNERVELEKTRIELQKEVDEFELRRIAFDEHKVAMNKLKVEPNDLVRLNIGGERTMTMKRSLLLQVDDTMLASMFSGRFEEQLDRDDAGNVFLDQSPAVMGPLIEFLRCRRDAAPGESPPMPVIPDEHRFAWRAMVRFFGLEKMFFPQVSRFHGIQTNLDMSSLEGWTCILRKPYSHATKIDDFKLPDETYNALIVGAAERDSGILRLAAMGSARVIQTETELNKTNYHNGAHWYCTSQKAIGFAPCPDIGLGPADSRDHSCELRLSWHLEGSGGYRVGSTCGLNSSSAWDKLILAGRVDLDIAL